MAKEWVEVFRGYEYHPHDFLVAFNAVVTRRYGPDAIRGAKVGWFGRRMPLSYYTVETGVTSELQVIGDGPLELAPFPKGTFFAKGNVLHAFIPGEYRLAAEELMLAIEAHLKTDSVYRGKAVTAGLEFMDVAAVDTASLTYHEKVQADLEAHVWTLIERPEQCRTAGIVRRRKVLFAGPYGSGKTMAALLTAAKAARHGWTFIYIETAMSPTHAIASTLEFAQKYQPAIVFVEDFDRDQREQSGYHLNYLMNSVDGALSKTGEIVVIMTTNFPEKIAAGLQRPGRIDKIINFGRFSATDIQRLLQMVIAPEMLAPDIAWSQVAASCDGYTPVFVREVATSAKLRAISTCGDAAPLVSEQMLVEAAKDLAAQHKACTADTPGFKAN